MFQEVGCHTAVFTVGCAEAVRRIGRIDADADLGMIGKPALFRSGQAQPLRGAGIAAAQPATTYRAVLFRRDAGERLVQCSRQDRPFLAHPETQLGLAQLRHRRDGDHVLQLVLIDQPVGHRRCADVGVGPTFERALCVVDHGKPDVGIAHRQFFMQMKIAFDRDRHAVEMQQARDTVFVIACVQKIRNGVVRVAEVEVPVTLRRF